MLFNKLNHRRFIIALFSMAFVLTGNYIHNIINIPMILIGWLLVGYAKSINSKATSFTDIHQDTWYMMITVVIIGVGNIVLLSIVKSDKYYVQLTFVGLLLFIFGKAALIISELHIYHAEKMLIILSTGMILISSMINIIYGSLLKSKQNKMITKYAKITAMIGWIIFLFNSIYIYHEETPKYDIF